MLLRFANRAPYIHLLIIFKLNPIPQIAKFHVILWKILQKINKMLSANFIQRRILQHPRPRCSRQPREKLNLTLIKIPKARPSTFPNHSTSNRSPLSAQYPNSRYSSNSRTTSKKSPPARSSKSKFPCRYPGFPDLNPKNST